MCKRRQLSNPPGGIRDPVIPMRVKIPRAARTVCPKCAAVSGMPLTAVKALGETAVINLRCAVCAHAWSASRPAEYAFIRAWPVIATTAGARYP